MTFVRLLASVSLLVPAAVMAQNRPQSGSNPILQQQARQDVAIARINAGWLNYLADSGRDLVRSSGRSDESIYASRLLAYAAWGKCVVRAAPAAAASFADPLRVGAGRQERELSNAFRGCGQAIPGTRYVPHDIRRAAIRDALSSVS